MLLPVYLCWRGAGLWRSHLLSALSSTSDRTRVSEGISSVHTSASSLLSTNTPAASSSRRRSSRPYLGSSGASMTRDQTSPSDPSPRESCPALATTPFLHSLTWTDNLPPSQGEPGSQEGAGPGRREGAGPWAREGAGAGSPVGAEPMSGEDSSDENNLQDYYERDRKSHLSSCVLSFQPVRVKRGGLQRRYHLC